MKTMAENITHVIHAHARVDAIYLYGSRARQTAHENSDWDIAVLFSDYGKLNFGMAAGIGIVMKECW
jgi:predicted nucleotidyltransferase